MSSHLFRLDNQTRDTLRKRPGQGNDEMVMDPVQEPTVNAHAFGEAEGYQWRVTDGIQSAAWANHRLQFRVAGVMVFFLHRLNN